MRHFEINIDTRIDRYAIDLSVDEMIDFLTLLNHKGVKYEQVKEITEKEFESHPNRQYFIEFDVYEFGETIHYVVKHENEENENDWNELITSLQ
jgi:hypothetical protein